MGGIFRRSTRDGDHLVVDDRTGFTIWASESGKQWDGLRMQKSRIDPRHPQEMIRTRADRQVVPDPRPPGVIFLVGPLIKEVSANVAAGSDTVPLVDTARMSTSDRVRISLYGGDFFETTIVEVHAASILLFRKLPGRVEAGALVVDVSAMAEGDL